MRQPMLDPEQTNNKAGNNLFFPEFVHAIDDYVSNCVNRLPGLGRPAALNGHELENSVRVITVVGVGRARSGPGCGLLWRIQDTGRAVSSKRAVTSGSSR